MANKEKQGKCHLHLGGVFFREIVSSGVGKEVTN